MHARCWVQCRLNALLEGRGLAVTELARRIGVTVVNLSVLKNNRAWAIRFSTLTVLCDALNCQPGNLFRVLPWPRPAAPQRGS